MANDLAIIAENKQTMGLTATSPLITVGRSEQNTVQILDPKVSRLHCKIEKTDKGIAFYDLHSKNGSFLNGKRCHFAFLKSGDSLRLGDNIIQFSPSAEPPETSWEQTIALSTQTNIPHPVPADKTTPPLTRGQILTILGTIQATLYPWLNKLKRSILAIKPIYRLSLGFFLIALTSFIVIIKPDASLEISQEKTKPALPEQLSSQHVQQQTTQTRVVTERDKKRALYLAREANTILSSGEPGKSIDLYKTALDIDPGNILAIEGLAAAHAHVDKLAKIYFDKGQTAMQAFNYQVAIKEFEAAALLLKKSNDQELLEKANKQLKQARQKIVN